MQCGDFGIPLIFAEFVSSRIIYLLDSATMLSIFQLLPSVVIWLISLSRARFLEIWITKQAAERMTVKGLPCGEFASRLPIFYKRLVFPTA